MGVIKSTFLTHPGAMQPQPESNVVFGCACATFLALLSLPLSYFMQESNPLPLMFGALCLLLVLWSPASFTPVQRAWIISSIVLGQAAITFVWVLYILPAGLIMQARGKDPLDLRFLPRAQTYWKPPHPTTSMQRSS